MGNKVKIFLLLILMSPLCSINAQELNCVVSVNARQIEGSEKVMFEEMQKSLFQLVNGRKWTSIPFESEERIECSILINLTERISANEFKGNIQIQASRPVYNSTYKSPIINVRMKILLFDTTNLNRFSTMKGHTMENW